MQCPDFGLAWGMNDDLWWMIIHSQPRFCKSWATHADSTIWQSLKIWKPGIFFLNWKSEKSNQSGSTAAWLSSSQDLLHWKTWQLLRKDLNLNFNVWYCAFSLQLVLSCVRILLMEKMEKREHDCKDKVQISLVVEKVGLHF